jgi:hypothetical protein
MEISLKGLLRTSFLVILLVIALFLTASCISQPVRMIILPSSQADEIQNGREPFSEWDIVENQRGLSDEGIPLWVRFHFDNNLRLLEDDRYLFVGTNSGVNFRALSQWADAFAARQDLPTLVTRRTQQRLLREASLYPDDEYGDFFEAFIRRLQNSVFEQGVKEETFWLKRNVRALDDFASDSEHENVASRFEFAVLLTVDKDYFQQIVLAIMDETQAVTNATREQAAALARLRHSFFDGF